MIRSGLIYLLYPFILGMAWILGTRRIFDTFNAQFWVLTGMLTAFHLAELALLFRQNRRLYLIQPVVIGTVILFLLQFGGVTNFMMRKQDGQFATLYNNILDREPQWLCYAMALVLASSVAYWWGYKLRLGSKIYKLYITYYNRFWDYKISYLRLVYGWIIGCVIKLVINYYGAIGHKYIILTLEHAYIPPFVMRLKVFENLSILFFIMLLFVYYQQRNNLLLRFILIFGFLFELVFALTSGARFTIVMLFLAIFLVDYIFSKRLKLVWVIILSGVLYLSMTLIASYKEYIFHDHREVLHHETSIKSFQDAMEYNKEKQASIQMNEELREAARIAVIARFNYVNELAQMIYYKDVEGMKPNDPDFVYPFLTFPVFAVLPKYYLFGVEEPGYGYWATKRLTGGRRTSTAISPIGFSYLAGGPVFVLFIFTLLGVIMKWVGLLMNNITSVVGLILFLPLMSQLAMFDSVVTGAYINIIRYSLLLPVVLWFFLSKPSEQKSFRPATSL